jgi:hypothetical protein
MAGKMQQNSYRLPFMTFSEVFIPNGSQAQAQIYFVLKEAPYFSRYY